MDHKQIIDQAIEQVLSERLLLSPGDTAAHFSDSMSYEFYRYDPNIVQTRAMQIKLGLA